jgi:NhaP-type Na+/H+ and K+/H+ antiporter
MKPTEIISAEYQKLGKDPSKFLRALNIALNKKLAIIMQENDTVLLLIATNDDNAELHLFTQDSPIKLAKALSRFVDKIRKSDLKAVYGPKEDVPNSNRLQQTLTMLKTLGVDVQPSDNPKYEWMAKV